jgi:membrane protease YdiL (CAAX protease family)
VAEEIFFRAFFYRALRTRLSVWSAALIDGSPRV